MKKVFIILLIILIASEYSYGQRRRKKRVTHIEEISISTVLTNFLGELGGANDIGTNGIKDFNFRAIRPGINIAYLYGLSNAFYIKTNLTYAFLSGDDKYTEEPCRNNRNLHFRSPIVELSSQLEYSIIRQKQGHRYNLRKRGVFGLKNVKTTSYIFAGFGMFYFNPKAKDLSEGGDGKWHSLRPLCTEGQGLVETREKYSPLQICIPLGIGVKFALDKRWSVGLEYGVRKTFTDYIDDVSITYFDKNELLKQKGDLSVYFANPAKNTLSPNVTAPGQQRGDPRDKDSYMFGIISIYYKIPRGGILAMFY
jgi:hypothetical protein